jgi:Beta-xylosidase
MPNNILIPGQQERTGLCETTVLCYRGQWIRIETVRIGQYESLHPEIPHAQLRDLDSGRILTTFMHGFELHHAFLWKDWIYVFATDYWGIWMSRTFDLVTWSQPEMVFDSEHSDEIHYQNNTVVWDGTRFIMGLDLLGGPYDFTICFAQSHDLHTWHYLPGAIYRPHLYTSCPLLTFDNGWYYLFHNRYSTERELFEIFVVRSRDLLVWNDSPNNPILSPNPAELLQPKQTGDHTIYHAINYSDLQLYEREGKTIGLVHVGDQTAGPQVYLIRTEFNGPLTEFYRELFPEDKK